MSQWTIAGREQSLVNIVQGENVEYRPVCAQLIWAFIRVDHIHLCYFTVNQVVGSLVV